MSKRKGTFESIAMDVIADTVRPLYENHERLSKHVVQTDSHEPHKFVSRPKTEWVATLDGQEIGRGPTTPPEGTFFVGVDPAREADSSVRVIVCPGCKATVQIPIGSKRTVCSACVGSAHSFSSGYFITSRDRFKVVDWDRAPRPAVQPPVGDGWYMYEGAVAIDGIRVPCKVACKEPIHRWERNVEFTVEFTTDNARVMEGLRSCVLGPTPLKLVVAGVSIHVVATQAQSSIAIRAMGHQHVMLRVEKMPVCEVCTTKVPLLLMEEHRLVVPDKNADDNARVFTLCRTHSKLFEGIDVAHVNGRLVWSKCSHCNCALPKSSKDGLCDNAACKEAHPRPEWTEVNQGTFLARTGQACAIVQDDPGYTSEGTTTPAPPFQIQWRVLYEGRRVANGLALSVDRAKLITSVWLNALQESGLALTTLLRGFSFIFWVWDRSPVGQLQARDEFMARQAADVPDGCDPVRWRRVVDVLTAWLLPENPALRETCGKAHWWMMAGVVLTVRSPVVAYARARSFRYTPTEATRKALPEGQMTEAIRRAFLAYEAG